MPLRDDFVGHAGEVTDGVANVVEAAGGGDFAGLGDCHVRNIKRRVRRDRREKVESLCRPPLALRAALRVMCAAPDNQKSYERPVKGERKANQ